MSARATSISTYGAGFIPDGHMRGLRALLVDFAAPGVGEAPGEHVEFVDVAQALVDSKLTTVYINPTYASCPDALALSRYLHEAVPSARVGVAVHPGAPEPLAWVPSETVLTMRYGQVWYEDDLPLSAHSVSLDYLPCDRHLAEIPDRVDAHLGYYLVLDGVTFGHAKVALAALADSRWQVVFNRPLDIVEAEEFNEHFHRRPGL